MYALLIYPSNRSSSEAEPIPSEFKVPLAIAESLLDLSVADPLTPTGKDAKETGETSTTSDGSEETANEVSFQCWYAMWCLQVRLTL
jgi:hypothetical protein